MKPSLFALLTQNSFTLRSILGAAHAVKMRVSLTEAYLIVLLFEHPLSRREITDRIKRDYSHVAHIVRSLQDRGYITIDNPSDKINNRVRLTIAGVEVYEEILRAIVSELSPPSVG